MTPLACLALNIYYEAATEPLAGKVAVAQVTLNRAERDPAKVCAAVYARSVVDGKKVAAFSWTLGAAWRSSGWNAETYRNCVWVADSVLKGSLLAPFDSSVRWYHADYVRPSWHKRFVTKIGHHLFYRSAG